MLFPNEKNRKICLSLFSEALNKANSFGSNKWGAYYQSDGIGIRLLVGNLIVFTIHKGEIWLALDKQILNESKVTQDLLENTSGWRWDTGRYSEYIPVPSKNGYYVTSEDDLRIWPYIRDLHFAYIKKVAEKYEWLNIRSQRKHSRDLLNYISIELEKDIPNPNYESFPDANPIHDIEEFKKAFKELSETEREAIVQSRIGQGEFRADLIRYWERCSVTGCELIRVLKASHIKPWRCSDNKERLDVFNGLLLIPNLDSAFDDGLISFDDEGKILLSNLLDDSDRHKLSIHPALSIRKIETDHIKYLQYHRKNIFRQN